MDFSKTFADKSVLVTGGAGFIGSHLVEALVNLGASVTVLDNLQAGLWSNLDGVRSKISIVEGDVRDYKTLEEIFKKGIDYVFHLAANANVPNSIDNPQYDFETNGAGSFALLETARKYNPDARIVLGSTAAVYGEPSKLPVDETCALAPVSPYGASKLCSEIEARVYHRMYGVQVIVARLFNTFGPRMPRYVVIDFLHKLKRDPSRLEIIGDGRQVRDFNYVGDTVNGLLTLAQSGIPGDAYNIASDKSYSITELAEMMLDLLDMKQTNIEYTNKDRAGDVRKFQANISKLRSLGYEPQTDLRQGLQHVIDWFKALPA